MKVIFLGTPSYVQPIKNELAKQFSLVESLEDADLAVVASYGKILTKDELNTPRYGCINVHPSLSPKYRGASPIQQAILNGDKVTGITIIKMDEEIDHGPIIYQEELGLSDNDNFDTLSKKMFHHAAEILPKIIEDFTSGKIKPKRQNHSQATYCGRLTRESGYFDINSPPSNEALDRMIRAYHPWPGVWTRWNGKIVKFLPSPRHPDPERAKQVEGEGSNYLLQMEGKKPLLMRDFINGYPDFPLASILNSS